MIAIDRESTSYRQLVHTPPCADSAVHARLVLDACPGYERDLRAVADLIVDTRLDEQDLPSLALGLECE